MALRSQRKKTKRSTSQKRVRSIEAVIDHSAQVLRKKAESVTIEEGDRHRLTKLKVVVTTTGRTVSTEGAAAPAPDQTPAVKETLVIIAATLADLAAVRQLNLTTTVDLPSCRMLKKK